MFYRFFLIYLLLLSSNVFAKPVKETPNNSKPTDLHCYYSSYKLKKNEEMKDVKVKICSTGSVKTEKSKKSSLSDRKSK